MELLTKDTHLDYSEDGTAWKELYGLASFPQMGGEPEKKEVSNMRDGAKRYIGGLEDTDSLNFDYFYNKEDSADAEGAAMIKRTFSALKALQAENKPIHWRLTYPDGTGYKWQGRPTPFMQSGAPGDPLKFTLSVSAETELEWFES